MPELFADGWGGVECLRFEEVTRQDTTDKISDTWGFAVGLGLWGLWERSSLV